MKKWTIVIVTRDGRIYDETGDLEVVLDMLVEPDYEVQRSLIFTGTPMPTDEFLRRAVEHGPWDVRKDLEKIIEVNRLIDFESEENGDGE